MYLATQNDFCARPERRGRTTPDTTLDPDTAPPQPLTSGFGVVIEKEDSLERINRDSLGDIHTVGKSELWRLLRHHQLLIEKNHELLLHRCEQLSHGERFARLHAENRPWADTPRAVAHDRHATLTDLLARHTSLIGDLDALISRARRGEHDEILLAEVERNHEEMAWMLMTLIKEAE
jgi:hypothetical protein